LQVFRQRLELGLADHDFSGKARLDEAGEVVVLGNLVKAQRQIVVGTDKLGRVERARLQRGKDLAGRHVGHRGAELAPDLAAQAGRTEPQALDIGNTGEFVAEPATSLRAGIARHETLHTELVVDLVPDFLAAQIADPGCQFAAGHAERHTGKER
jgi:hypothetical protein